MAKKISNNLLSVLLSFAILTSVVGILASMNILSPLTGAATSANATVNISVTSIASCTMADTHINFTALARGATNWSEATNSSGYGMVNDWHTLENDGNTNLTITVWGSEALWDSTNNDANWMARCNNTQSGTCTTTYANVPNTVGSAITVLTGLEPLDASDLASFGLNVTAPNDELTGSKSGTLTYICTTV
ncbi:MAG: hypothetical protein ABIJ20_02615 [Nanoarchaeota archaeon]|nr:hypothetical protein [Nanoarchaeota archaeon]MBU1445074.1 hypothetical protein [Nanoarchaeota archaeon]MBU2420738.1 hypothetical protein [Nanoarchaeota archaeon]MBU2475201.1 hypothetical protein [Nanoarchaeota archaeon]